MFLFSFPAGIKSKVLVLFYIYIMEEIKQKNLPISEAGTQTSILPMN